MKSLYLAVIILFGSASLTFAQKASAFSPTKSGTTTMKSIKTIEDVHAVKDGDMVGMACPSCKTISYTYVDRSAKTPNQVEKTVIIDACPGCGEKIETVGTGKQGKNVVKHVCKKCGSHEAFCCVKVEEAAAK